MDKFKDSMERTQNLKEIMISFHAKINNAYVDLLKYLTEYGQDSECVNLYNAVGYSWIVETELEGLYGTEKVIKKLLQEFYANKS